MIFSFSWNLNILQYLLTKLFFLISRLIYTCSLNWLRPSKPIFSNVCGISGTQFNELKNLALTDHLMPCMLNMLKTFSEWYGVHRMLNKKKSTKKIKNTCCKHAYSYMYFEETMWTQNRGFRRWYFMYYVQICIKIALLNRRFRCDCMLYKF